MPVQARRTLVKSPPELWALLSDAESLGRRLEPFGEIRITRLEPESTVAWEGEHARGTVEIEPSGWGTRVTLTAEAGSVAAKAAEADVATTDVAAADGAEVEPPRVHPEEAAPAQAAPPEPVPAVAVAPPEPLEPATAGAAEQTSQPLPVGPVAEPRPRLLTRLGRWLRGGRERDDAPSADPAVPASPPEPEPEPETEPEPHGAQFLGPEPVPAWSPEPEPEPDVPPPPAPVPDLPPESEPAPAPPPAAGLDDREVDQVLSGVLDDLGSAHHRPFSRG